MEHKNTKMVMGRREHKPLLYNNPTYCTVSIVVTTLAAVKRTDAIESYLEGRDFLLM